MMSSDTYNGDEKMKTGADTELALAPSNNMGEVEDAHAGSTQRGLKSRHAQMIALGGTIGTGLFVGSGQGLRIGGPAFFFIGYCLITILVFGIVRSCASLATPHGIKLTILVLGHCYHRDELLPASPWIDDGLLWKQISLQIHGLRLGLDVLVHLYNHRTGGDHCSQCSHSILEPSSQCRCVDHGFYDRDHSIELLPSQILW